MEEEEFVRKGWAGKSKREKGERRGARKIGKGRGWVRESNQERENGRSEREKNEKGRKETEEEARKKGVMKSKCVKEKGVAKEAVKKGEKG